MRSKGRHVVRSFLDRVASDRARTCEVAEARSSGRKLRTACPELVPALLDGTEAGPELLAVRQTPVTAVTAVIPLEFHAPPMTAAAGTAPAAVIASRGKHAAMTA